MLSKANFRYVRPMQVFEPTVASLSASNYESEYYEPSPPSLTDVEPCLAL